MPQETQTTSLITLCTRLAWAASDSVHLQEPINISRSQTLPRSLPKPTLLLCGCIYSTRTVREFLPFHYLTKKKLASDITGQLRWCPILYKGYEDDQGTVSRAPGLFYDRVDRYLRVFVTTSDTTDYPSVSVICFLFLQLTMP